MQNTQNRDARALHLKLDELLRSMRMAPSRLIDLENCTDEEWRRRSRWLFWPGGGRVCRHCQDCRRDRCTCFGVARLDRPNRVVAHLPDRHSLISEIGERGVQSGKPKTRAPEGFRSREPHWPGSDGWAQSLIRAY